MSHGHEGDDDQDLPASTARHDFKDVLDAAIEGEPQFIRRRDGREVVAASREYFEKIRPTLKSYLLAEGLSGEGDDAFDLAMSELHSEGGGFMSSGAAELST